MSVIAKMYLQESVKYGTNQLLSLACVAENEFMAGYSKGNEDVLFTQASPNGSARITLQNDPGAEPQDKFYFIFQKGEKPNLDGAIAWAPVRIYGITDYGGTTKQVEILGRRNYNDKFTDSIEALNVNYKISIDNPGASDQFRAGDQDWWLTVYPCRLFTSQEALTKAHAARQVIEPTSAE